MRTRIAVAAGALWMFVFLAVGQASAQEREGGWFGVGAGWGSADLTCDDCGSGGSRQNSGVFVVNGGYTVNPKVLVGAELNLWTKSYTDPELSGTVGVNFYNILGTATFYPARNGFFLKGGAGVAFFDMDLKASGFSATVDMGKGLGLIVGGGFDIPAGRIAITPAVNYWYANTGDLTFEGETLLGGVKHNVITVTIGVKFP